MCTPEDRDLPSEADRKNAQVKEKAGRAREKSAPKAIYAAGLRKEENEDPVATYAVLEEETKSKAILDCGASESIIGAHTLQHMYETLENHGRDPELDIAVDRTKHRSFVFGNNQSSVALGLAQMIAGIGGKDVKLSMHIVEGQTPLLLSSRWLWEQEAVINFGNGKAKFKCLGDRQVQLERAATNHLMLPIDTFVDSSIQQKVPDEERCPSVDALSEPSPARAHDTPQ